MELKIGDRIKHNRIGTIAIVRSGLKQFSQSMDHLQGYDCFIPAEKETAFLLKTKIFDWDLIPSKNIYLRNKAGALISSDLLKEVDLTKEFLEVQQ